MRAIALFLVIMLVSAVPVQGQPTFLAGHLKAACSTPQKQGWQMDLNFCLGYMYAFIEGMPKDACFDIETTPSRLLALLLSRMERRPDDAMMPARTILMQELPAASSCKTTRESR